MAKNFEWQTFVDLQFKYQFYVVLLIFIAIVLASVGLILFSGMKKEVPSTNQKPEGGSKIVPAKIVGGIICLGLAALSGYYAYNTMIDSKNEKTCNAAFWSKTECVSFPTISEDSVYEINVSLCSAQTKAQYDGYAGFYTKSNVTNMFDVIYLAGDTEAVTATDGSDTLYVKKPRNKDEKVIKVTGGGNCNPSPPPECSPGLAKTLEISPAGSGQCFSPCPSNQRRYGSNVTCENTVSSNFTITNLTGTSTSITFTDNGSGSDTKPRNVWLQLYSDSSKTNMVGSMLLFTRSGNDWTYNIPSGGTPFTTGTKYYYRYKINELTTQLKDPLGTWNTSFTINDGKIITVAGTGTAGFTGDGGPATSASLNNTHGILFDSDGNMYVCDMQNDRIRKISTNGTITTIAGSGTPGTYGENGPATSAFIDAPRGIAIDSIGNLYITLTARVRKLTKNSDGTYTITTIAGTGTAGFSGDGGAALSAQVDSPSGIVLDSAGNIYISDTENHRIRKILTNGTIITIAGSGTAGFSGDGGSSLLAEFNKPTGLATDSSGNIYVCDKDNRNVRKLTKNSDGTYTISTIVSSTVFENLYTYGIVLDKDNNMYVSGAKKVRKISSDGNTVTVLTGSATTGFSGDGGPATSAQVNLPFGIALSSDNYLYISDTWNNRIRKLT